VYNAALYVSSAAIARLVSNDADVREAFGGVVWVLIPHTQSRILSIAATCLFVPLGTPPLSNPNLTPNPNPNPNPTPTSTPTPTPTPTLTLTRQAASLDRRHLRMLLRRRQSRRRCARPHRPRHHRRPNQDGLVHGRDLHRSGRCMCRIILTANIMANLSLAGLRYT